MPAPTRPAKELGVEVDLARSAARGRSRRAGLRGRGLHQPRRLGHRPRAARRERAGRPGVGRDEPQDSGRDLRLGPQGRQLRQLRRHRQRQGRPDGGRARRSLASAARARWCCCATPKGTTAPASASRASSRRMAEHPGIKVVSSNQYAGTDVEGAYKKAEALLTSLKNPDGIARRRRHVLRERVVDVRRDARAAGERLGGQGQVRRLRRLAEPGQGAARRRTRRPGRPGSRCRWATSA